MKCCICGNPVGQWGNNPFPLCNKDDYESRCCDNCNEMVIQARIIQSGKRDQKIEVGDDLMIFYAKNSTSPTEIIKDQNKFLAGTINSIVQKDKSTIYEGTWGSFTLDSETDQFVKI